MNDRISALCQRIISPSYVDQGRDARKSLENKIAHLLEQVRALRFLESFDKNKF